MGGSSSYWEGRVQKSQNTRNCVEKIAKYAHFGRKNHNIRASKFCTLLRIFVHYWENLYITLFSPNRNRYPALPDNNLLERRIGCFGMFVLGEKCSLAIEALWGMILWVCEGNAFARLKVAVHVSASGSEAALAAAPGPDLVSSLPGNKGAPLPPPLPNHSMRN